MQQIARKSPLCSSNYICLLPNAATSHFFWSPISFDPAYEWRNLCPLHIWLPFVLFLMRNLLSFDPLGYFFWSLIFFLDPSPHFRRIWIRRWCQGWVTLYYLSIPIANLISPPFQFVGMIGLPWRRRLLEELDTTQDGVVSFDEFLAWWRKNIMEAWGKSSKWL